MASSLDQDSARESENRSRNQPQGDSMNGLQVGDMVWGKVKSHPWWPGHIFDESFAGSSVRKTRHAEGRKSNAVLVAFFGDSSYGWFDPSELIPFGPNFHEMSTQANYKSFVNAVSEAVDEAARRGALAVTCKCRDESNFSPTEVENYVFVDVPGYEGGGIYSHRQIEASRNMFDPVDAALFVTDMALGPNDMAAMYSNGADAVTFMQLTAMMVGYRRAVFEENDETYAQAFGVDPAKVDRSAGVGTQKRHERITHRAVPLSGGLKIAETPGASSKRRTAASSSASAKATKSKHKPKPKPKPLSQTQHQPRFKSTPSKKTAASAVAAVTVAATSEDNKYLLKRRDDAEPDAASVLPDLQFPLPIPDQPDTSFLVSPAAESGGMGGPDDTYVLQRRERKEEEEEKEKKPVKEKPLQKRKKLEGESSAAAAPGVKSEGGEGNSEKKRKKKKQPVASGSMDLNTAQLVGDLHELALEPLYGKERDAAAPVRHLVLNFRSAVYQKSLVNQAASGKSDVVRAKKLKLKEKKVVPVTASKPLVKKQGLKKPDDSSLSPGTTPSPSPSVIGRKRGPSDRQEELTVKKQKKMDKIKALATEKKLALANAKANALKAIEEEKKKEIKVQKPEPPAAPKVVSPTALMMKFPLKTALPTIATLKAKLARFGPMELSNTRVYWNSHMCKVTFKFKEDAKAALNYLNSNELFGQSKVQYYIRELDPPAGQEAGSESRAPPEPVSVRTGSKIGPEPTETRPRPSLFTQPPKSILKKPGEDAGASSGAGGGPRVTFMLDRANSKTIRPEVPASMPIGGNGGSVTNKSTPLAPPPPLVSRPQLVHPTRPPPFDVRHLPPPPPLLAARPGSAQWAGERSLAHGQVGPGLLSPVQLAHSGPFSGSEERKKEAEDISGPLLGLLRQCSDIVAKVKNSFGYLPYHPL